MGVAAEILEHIFRAPERWFGVNHPVLSEQRSQPRSEDLGLREQCQIAGKMKLAIFRNTLTAAKLQAWRNNIARNIPTWS